jgi:arylamine N-acetyltransferase
MTKRKRWRLHKGDTFSEGTRLLWLRLLADGWTVQRARVVLGCAEGALNKILYGDKRPGLRLALSIEQHFGVPAAAWRAEPTAPFELPAHMEVA